MVSFLDMYRSWLIFILKITRMILSKQWVAETYQQQKLDLFDL